MASCNPFLSFARLLYLHVLLLLTFFGAASSEATGGDTGTVLTSSRGCPISRLQVAFQAPFNSLSATLHGSLGSASSPLGASTSRSAVAPSWVVEGARSARAPRVLRSRRVDVLPLGMSAVQDEVKQGTKRSAEDAPKETKEEKRARRQAATGKTLGVHVIGLSHHNAGVDVREKLAVPEANWNEASAEVLDCMLDIVSLCCWSCACRRNSANGY